MYASILIILLVQVNIEGQIKFFAAEKRKILNIHGNISVIFFSLNNTRWCIYLQKTDSKQIHLNSYLNSF